jgi:hypothetical protein
VLANELPVKRKLVKYERADYGGCYVQALQKEKKKKKKKRKRNLIDNVILFTLMRPCVQKLIIKTL